VLIGERGNRAEKRDEQDHSEKTIPDHDKPPLKQRQSRHSWRPGIENQQ
jgi:hypothetical protein